MRTFQDFITEARKKVKIEVNPQKPIEYKIADIGPGKKEHNVKTSKGWTNEAYDADVMSSSQIRKTGEGGRIGAKRVKTTPERRRVRAVGGGRTEPVKYKERKDIGQQRQTSTREQQPTQERGSARERQLAAAKEERKKAAQARIAARKTGQAPAAEKPKAKEVTKTASKLLSTKKPEAKPAPGYTPPKASGMTRAERDRARNQAKKELYNQRKAKLFADYKEVHGSNPTGKERTRLLGLANKSLKS